MYQGMYQGKTRRYWTQISTVDPTDQGKEREKKMERRKGICVRKSHTKRRKSEGESDKVRETSDTKGRKEARL